MGDNNRPVPLEPEANDPGEHSVDDPKPHPFPSSDGHRLGNPTVDRDDIADAAGHSRFHAVAKAGSYMPAVVKSPIFDEPEEVAIDSIGSRSSTINPPASPRPSCCSVSACG